MLFIIDCILFYCCTLFWRRTWPKRSRSAFRKKPVWSIKKSQLLKNPPCNPGRFLGCPWLIIYSKEILGNLGLISSNWIPILAAGLIVTISSIVIVKWQIRKSQQPAVVWFLVNRAFCLFSLNRKKEKKSQEIWTGNYRYNFSVASFVVLFLKRVSDAVAGLGNRVPVAATP